MLWPLRKRRKYRPGDWAAMVAMIAGGITCGAAHTFRLGECFAFLAALALPTVIVLVTWYAGENPYWPEPLIDDNAEGRTRSRYGGMIFPVIAFTVLLTGLCLQANQYFDHSEADVRSFDVTNKYITTKKSRHYYKLTIDDPATPPLAFLDFGKTKTFSVSYGDYERAQPGRSMVTIRMHSGFLNFPWYETPYSVN